MAKPISIAKGVFLCVRPEGLALHGLEGRDGFLHASIGLRARPRVVVGPEPAAVATPLPRIETWTPEPAFHVVCEAEVSLRRAQELLTKELTKDALHFTKGVVKIHSARVYGSGDQAVLALTVDAPFRGVLYLAAKPSFDLATYTLSFHDLDFTVESRSYLLRVADWLVRSEPVREQIEARAHISLESELAPTLAKLKALSVPIGSAGHADVAVTALEVRPPSFTETAVKTVVAASGTARVTLTAIPQSK
jgi:hypothetical protein